MGLFDKLTAKLASMGIDHAQVLTEQLGSDDPLVACAGMVPAAYKRGGGLAMNGTQIAMKAVDAATNKNSGDRHVGGAEGTIARSLPRDGGLVQGALSARGLSLWDFGMNGQATPPSLVLRIGGEHLRSVVDTGKKAQGGAIVVRFTFTDDSFFDYRVVPNGRDFIEACATRWPA